MTDAREKLRMSETGRARRGADPAVHASRASARITLRNLIAARWVLLVLVLVVALVELLARGAVPALVGWMPSSERPWAVLLVLACWSLLNGVSVWLLAKDRASDGVAGLHLLIDAAALTVLFGLSGGATNPFTILYFLPITLATQVSPRWTWALALFCLACFASLFVFVPSIDEMPAHEAVPVEQADPHAHHHHEASPAEPAIAPSDAPQPGRADEAQHEHGSHFAGHLRGMWIAFGIAGVLMTVFVHRIALALTRQRDELVRLRQIALEDRQLAAIGTLAAGAAHELGTPLGTIKLLADELPAMDPSERDEALRTIREQLARCKLIVSRMASPELRVSALGVGEEAWPLGELAEEIEAQALDVPLELVIDPSAAAVETRQPFEVLAQLLRELVVNAAEACRRTGDPTRGVTLTIACEGDQALLVVRDRGVGMDTETLASAFDPFFTTRPEGQGMGLGLFLARAHLRQLDGTIELDATPGQGTTAKVRFPLDRGLMGESA